ncbi:hypothetical protein O0L34_g19442 [Tuta absoluta]|nr:hypothetical protein O0L34_g19442 [Tuta absoluta]
MSKVKPNVSSPAAEKCAKCRKPPSTEKSKMSVVCDLCKVLLCADCHGLSPAEIRVLELKTVARVMTFLCGDCKNTMVQLPTIMKKLNELTEEVKQLRLRQSMLATESAINEMSERANRSTNLIIYDIPEPTIGDVDQRRAHDSEQCKKIIAKVTNKVNCSGIKVFRLGAPKTSPGANPRPRPVKVILKNKSDAIEVLRNKAKLENSRAVTADLTPMQREYLKYLREELDKRSNDGEADLTIKYVRGQPMIVKKGPSQKN